MLRSVAVGIVLYSHAASLFGWTVPARFGYLGVLLFFVHTSFVLMMSMERMNAGGEPFARRFYIRRVFRIYPLAVALILVSIPLRIPIYMGVPYAWHGMRNLAMNLLLMNNFPGVIVSSAPLWSLSCEVQMYLVLPLLFLLMRRRETFSGILLVLAAVVLAELERIFLSPAPFRAFFEYAPWFCAGIAAYMVSRVRPRSWPIWIFYCNLVALIAIQVLFAVSNRWIPLAAGTLFALSLPRFREVQATVIRRSSAVIARYSYGIYLAHVPILWLVMDHFPGAPASLRIALFVILLPLSAYSLYHVIERPMIDLGAKVSGSNNTRMAAVAA